MHRISGSCCIGFLTRGNSLLLRSFYPTSGSSEIMLYAIIFRVWKYISIYGRKSIWFDWFRQIQYIYKTKYAAYGSNCHIYGEDRISSRVSERRCGVVHLYAFTNGFFSTVDSIPRKIDHRREIYAMRIDSRPHHFWIYSRRYVDIFSILSFFLLFFTTHLLHLYNRAGERASSGQRLNTNKNWKDFKKKVDLPKRRRINNEMDPSNCGG